MRALGQATVGLGFRPELAADLMASPELVDFVEIVAETCFTQRATRREAAAIREIWPVIPHGVKLSLGSAAGIDDGRVQRLGVLARELRAPVISEHVSFSRGGGTEIGHLTQLPRSREAVRVVARNVDRARRLLPDVPLLLENVAWSFLWPDDEMDEATFYQEIARATGCELLLDVGNLYANAVNEGRDPREVLVGYPLDRVAMVHVAGGEWEDGFYFDTHAHGVPAEVIALVGEVLARRPELPVLIERDANIELAGLANELEALRALPRGVEIGSDPISRFRPNFGRERELRSEIGSAPISPARLATEQADLARELVGRDRVTTEIALRVGEPAIVRSRGILERKRIDDALPLLENLGRTPLELRRVAEHALATHARADARVAPTDAWHIAEAALAEPALAAAARFDLLLLRARFSRPRDGAVKPRSAPFIGFARLDDGTRIRATKGFGSLAPVMVRTAR